MLDERELSTAGKKAELIDRLLEGTAAAPTEAAEEEAEEAAEEAGDQTQPAEAPRSVRRQEEFRSVRRATRARGT